MIDSLCKREKKFATCAICEATDLTSNLSLIRKQYYNQLLDL